MNTFKPIMWVVGAFIFVYIIYSVATKGLLGALNMNLVIFLFVGINCFLFPEPHAWIEAHSNSMHLATDVMLQFPFYGAIMGMMYLDGGLGSVLVTRHCLHSQCSRPCLFSPSFRPVSPICSFLSGWSVHCGGPLIVEAAVTAIRAPTWSTASTPLSMATSAPTCSSRCMSFLPCLWSA